MRGTGLLLAIVVASLADSVSARPDAIAAAVASPARPEADRARDADRQPAEVLEFFGIAPGMKVADLAAGAGYYSEILAGVVGAEGRVYLQNNAAMYEKFGDMGVPARLARPELGNVVRWDRGLDELALPSGELDAALLVLLYHDTFWIGLDRAAMNAAILAALEPGGTFGVIDHHAEAGSGARDADKLHRGDAEQIKAEILAAGFEWVGESAVLRHPEDDRTQGVFADGLRGKTDRFVYRFRKPETPAAR